MWAARAVKSAFGAKDGRKGIAESGMTTRYMKA